MSLIAVLILSVALAIDASIASFSQGTILTVNKRKNSFMLALFMALFQGIMPVIGWFIARGFYSQLKEFDHWIAFIVFLILGIKFIYDALKNNGDEEKLRTCLSIYCILSLSFATSIDALVAGATLSFLDISIVFPSIVIGIITFIGSLMGFWSGYYLKKINKTAFEVLGGVLLIALGVKILVEHLFFAGSGI